MKTYILTFFMLLSGLAFGQDSLVNKISQKGLELVLAISVDTLTSYDTTIINSYILNKKEKDSIYKSYLKSNKKFLKPYKKDWKQLIVQKYPSNSSLRNLLFFCLLNTDKIDNDAKKELFFEKFSKDWAFCYRTDCPDIKPIRDESRIRYINKKPYRTKWEKRTNYVHSKQIAINSFVGRIENWKLNLYKLRPYVFAEVEDDNFTIKNHRIDKDVEIHNIKEKIADLEILAVEIVNQEEYENLLGEKTETENSLIIYYKKIINHNEN